MENYKKIIFLKAVKVRVANGDGTAEAIIESYGKLTNHEKRELKAEFKG